MEKKSNESVTKCLVESEDILSALAGLFERKIRNLEKRFTKCEILLEKLNSGEELNDDQRACALITPELANMLEYLREISLFVVNINLTSNNSNTKSKTCADETKNKSSEPIGINDNINNITISGFLEFTNKLKLLSYNINELKKPEHAQKLSLTENELNNLNNLYSLVKTKENVDAHTRITRIESIYTNILRKSSSLVGYPVEGTYAHVSESYDKIDENLRKIKVRKSNKIDHTNNNIISPIIECAESKNTNKIGLIDNQLSKLSEIAQNNDNKIDACVIPIETINKIIQTVKTAEDVIVAKEDELKDEGKFGHRQNYRTDMRGRYNRNNRYNRNENTRQYNDNLENNEIYTKTTDDNRDNTEITHGDNFYNRRTRDNYRNYNNEYRDRKIYKQHDNQNNTEHAQNNDQNTNIDDKLSNNRQNGNRNHYRNNYRNENYRENQKHDTKNDENIKEENNKEFSKRDNRKNYDKNYEKRNYTKLHDRNNDRNEINKESQPAESKESEIPKINDENTNNTAKESRNNVRNNYRNNRENNYRNDKEGEEKGKFNKSRTHITVSDQKNEQQDQKQDYPKEQVKDTKIENKNENKQEVKKNADYKPKTNRINKRPTVSVVVRDVKTEHLMNGIQTSSKQA